MDKRQALIVLFLLVASLQLIAAEKGNTFFSRSSNSLVFISPKIITNPDNSPGLRRLTSFW
jgi:hypothetical protein